MYLTILSVNDEGDYGEISCGYNSVSDSLTLVLHTDDTTTSTGFKATYISTSDSTPIAGE